MQVLHVISSMDAKGGGVSQAVRLFIAGSEPGVQHEVVSCDSPDAEWLGKDTFPLHALGPAKFGYAYSPRLLPWLSANFPRFDAVIVHGLWLWPSIATHIAMRKLEKTASLTGNTSSTELTKLTESEIKPAVLTGLTGASAGSIERSPSEEPNDPGSDGKSICEQSQASSVPEDFEPKSPRPNDESHSDHSVNSVKKVPRCFVMPHGMLDPYFQRAPERRIKAIRNWIYWKLIEHRVINSADGVLFTCEEEMRLAREPFRPYNPKAEKVVGLGTEEPPPYAPSMTEAFAKACPDLGDQPYILFLGRIHPKKGVDMLIRAYKKLETEFTKLAELNASQTGPTGLSGESCGSVGLSPNEEPTKVDSVGKSICEQSQTSSVSEDFEAKSLRPHDEKSFCSIPSIRSETHPPEHLVAPANSVNPVKKLPALVIAGPCHDREYLQRLKQESSVSIREIGGSKNVSVSTNHSVHSVHSVPNCIHFVDMLTGDAKWGALYGCAAFILPSHQENFGIAVVEALACGKPVLISNKVNIWREIEADGAGLVEDDAIEGTEKLIRRFLTQYPESHQVSAAANSLNAIAKSCFKKRFSIEQAAESLCRAIRETTTDSSRQPSS